MIPPPLAHDTDVSPLCIDCEDDTIRPIFGVDLDILDGATYSLGMNAMPVAPEKLIATFSLSQVLEMVVAFEDATLGLDSHAGESYKPKADDAATVRPGKVES